MVFKTGQKCPEAGVYEFVGYVSKGIITAEPIFDELTILLAQGDAFPLVRSLNRAAYWRRVSAR